MDHARYEKEFAAEAARLATVASGQDPARTVVTCPDWTVRDLVTHVGRGHRSATALVAEKMTSPGTFSTAGAPEDPADWPAWVAVGAQGLIDAIRTTGPDFPVWTWQQQDPTAGFWLRRMLHDLIVHRYDAELTAGGPGPIAADLAADGVADMLGCIAVIARETLAGEGSLRFEAADHPASWRVSRTAEGVTWSDHDGAAADVTVRAPVRELLLLLNRRIGPGAVEVTGDQALLGLWWENTRF